MSEPLPTEHARAGPLTDAEREARIEQLLLSGLDHYFAGNYEQAINVWTRVAFLERGHARARAYIERARSALAERQRESEETLHSGVAAYQAGDFQRARELLTRAVDHVGQSETALLLLDRLSRAEAVASGARAASSHAPSLARRQHAADGSARSAWLLTILTSAGLVLAITIAARAVTSRLADWPLDTPPASAVPAEPVPLVRSSDILLDRAQELYVAGQLREAWTTLEQLGPVARGRPQADQLRAAVQQALLAEGDRLGGGPGDPR